MTAQAKAVPSATLQQQATPRCGEKDVDLSSLFSPENRDQKDALACTAFASARLLEAAIRSYYGSSPHLSEADIFALLLQKGKVNPGAGIYYTAFPSTEEELDLALANGVATAKTVPYTNRFLDRYDRFMEGHEQIKNDLENGISGSKEPYALLERRASDKQSRLLNQLLVNNSPQAAAERKRIKEMLKPFKRDRQPFSKYTPDQTKATLMNYLCRGIPVSVAMDITGLPEWNHFQAQENEFAGHQIIVYGFHKAERGFVFLTRNSWGDTTHSTPSVNPEITEDRLSKISSAVALVPNSPLSEEAREKMTERMQETSSSLEARH